jgi:CelD/BcsL family acetyltransferase involved in cellulose biosynthesis
MGDGYLYKIFTPIALERDWVDLSTIHLENKIVGFAYFLRHGNRYSLNRSDYDLEYKHLAPGNALKLLVLKELYKKGEICEYDWGGDPTSYKLEWCDNIRRHVTLAVGNNNIRGRGIMFIKKRLLPSIRRITGAGN